ncbi:MAG: MTAP family purine nucleoside phosphorylase [bacterium]
MDVLKSQNIVARQRHAFSDGYRPPHRINHQANIQALANRDVSTILAIQSTGSLDPEITPGTFVVPDDFINPWAPVTFYDDDRGHGVSEFSNPLRKSILESLQLQDHPYRNSGIYFQTRGPRFETPAEANLLADYGDIVGMTAGSEVTLAREKDMDYATVCSVDNYVNGVSGESIDMESFEASVDEHVPTVVDVLETILKRSFNLTLPEG